MKRRFAILILCLLIAIPILFGGWACAKMTATQKGAVGGGAVGTVAGALLGGGKGALIGAGVGALGGALVNDALKKGK
jgi:hypothetical protein